MCQLYEIRDGYNYFTTETTNHLVYCLMQYQYRNTKNCRALNTLKLDELVLVTQLRNIHDHGNSVYALLSQQEDHYYQHHEEEH